MNVTMRSRIASMSRERRAIISLSGMACIVAPEATSHSSKWSRYFALWSLRCAVSTSANPAYC
jgi:hypothetical protein